MSTNAMINTDSFLSSNTITLNDLLGANVYIVPKYQRPYSWKDEQVLALWHDLVETTDQAFSEAGPVHSPTPHFMGPLVLEQTDDSRSPEIMDGQQRLVTLTALLSVLRGFFDDDTEESNVWRRSIEELLFQHRSGSKIPRLRLAKDDEHYRELIVHRYTASDRGSYFEAQGPVNKNTVLWRINRTAALLTDGLAAYLSKSSPIPKVERVIRLTKGVLDLTVFLQLKVREQGVAYEVFEGLNARGLDLQQADLLKNRLFALADAQNTEKEVDQQWSRVEKAIDNQNTVSLTEFLLFHFLAIHGDTKQNSLYNNVKTLLSKGSPSALHYTRSIAESAESLQTMLDAGATFSASAARHLTSIRDALGVKYALVLLIAGAFHHKVDSEDQAKIIQLTHDYTFRYFHVMDTNLSKYSGDVGDLARKYTAKAFTDPTKLAEAMRVQCDPAVFRAKFADYSAPNNRLGFYTIETIENYLGKNAGVVLHPQSPAQHLEHIMPKNPSGQAGWDHVANDPLYRDYVNRIGNLLVLEANINSAIKNKALSAKLRSGSSKSYSDSKLRLPHDIDQYVENDLWNFDSIKRRQEALSEHALNAWPL